MTRTHLTIFALVLVSLAANAVESKPRHVFVKSSCKEPLGMEVLASFRQEIRASAGYQLAKSLDDDGGYDVVITVDIVCGEAEVSSVRMASVASLFGTGTCTFGTCSITPNQLTLQAQFCGKSGTQVWKRDFRFPRRVHEQGRGRHLSRALRSSEENTWEIRADPPTFSPRAAHPRGFRKAGIRTPHHRHDREGHDFQSCRSSSNPEPGFSRWGPRIQFESGERGSVTILGGVRGGKIRR
jgi:hypothetical protein